MIRSNYGWVEKGIQIQLLEWKFRKLSENYGLLATMPCFLGVMWRTWRTLY